MGLNSLPGDLKRKKNTSIANERLAENYWMRAWNIWFVRCRNWHFLLLVPSQFNHRRRPLFGLSVCLFAVIATKQLKPCFMMSEMRWFKNNSSLVQLLTILHTKCRRHHTDKSCCVWCCFYLCNNIDRASRSNLFYQKTTYICYRIMVAKKGVFGCGT